MSQSHYTPQPSEYSFSDYSVPLFHTSNETKSAQNFLPGFAPHFSALWNALGPVDPTSTSSLMGGTAAHPVSLPATLGYPGSSPPPSLTHSGDNSPASESSTLLSTSPSAPANWPLAIRFWQDSSLLATDNHPENPPPDRNRGDQSHETWNAYQHSTIRHNLLNDEGIEAKHNKFELPASVGQIYTSEIGAENDSPNALQVQSTDDDVSRGARKGKRKADDSPSTDDSDPPSRKRARLPVYEDHSVEGDQQASSTSGYQVEMHQGECYTASAPGNHAPALGQSGSRMIEKPDKEYPFYKHVGTVNIKGEARTRKLRMQDYLADTAESSTALTATEAPAALDIGLSSENRDVARNAVYEENGGYNRLLWMDGGKRVSTRRRAPIRSSIRK
ncbi:hypothetical protein HYPSUDRAFT_41873 [Hypholoma sublateritium FD-334 SS-4]|uniref:Uncharacterized protein n=1 Tax=Hypholoma sublateritium (strain FD-334 SS-4) TaxID=945553 RepID=A0A0D2MD84_HYPSF|nr:hypothetical protein HYPSUDRAFT_41873 [Hypholoma sublateritium FD-334 SS-4]